MSFEELMSLVEDVRNILDLDERVSQRTRRKIAAKHKQSTRHTPFMHRKKIGPTSKSVALVRGPKTNTQSKNWKCRCHNYDCFCIGKNEEGKQIRKHVRIKRAYKHGYNTRYKAWRKKHAKRFKRGADKD